jgi:hypothetical protein
MFPDCYEELGASRLPVENVAVARCTEVTT